MLVLFSFIKQNEITTENPFLGKLFDFLSDKEQIIPDFIKSLQKYINLTSIPKNKNKSRHKKDKLKTNKSANNIKITNKKYMSTNDFKSETTKIKLLFYYTDFLPQDRKIFNLCT